MSGRPSLAAQLRALVAVHLYDRRRAVLAWGLPLGLMSAFIVAIFPSVERSLSKVATGLLCGLGSLLAGSGLDAGRAAEGFANVWPLALLFAGFGAIAAGFSLRTSVVTGSVAGLLVAMYVVDPIGRLDTGLADLRYLPVVK